MAVREGGVILVFELMLVRVSFMDRGPAIRRRSVHEAPPRFLPLGSRQVPPGATDQTRHVGERSGSPHVEPRRASGRAIGGTKTRISRQAEGSSALGARSCHRNAGRRYESRSGAETVQVRGDRPDVGAPAVRGGAREHRGDPSSDPSSNPASVTPSRHDRSTRIPANLLVRGCRVERLPVRLMYGACACMRTLRPFECSFS